MKNPDYPIEGYRHIYFATSPTRVGLQPHLLEYNLVLLKGARDYNS
jgi:hypothetical protein